MCGTVIASLSVAMQPCESPKPANLQEALELVDSMAITIRLQSLKIDQLTRRLFGPTSEKLPLEDNQLPLLDQDSSSEPAVSSDVLIEKEEVDQPERKPRASRQPVAKDLEVVEERLEPEAKVCPHCGQERCVIREDTSEKYDFIPARLICRRTIRPVLACSSCKDGVVQAPMPASIAPKRMCSEGLIAHVVLQKYLEHRPLYRQQQEFLRLGATISRTVLSDAMETAAVALQPLWKLIRDGLTKADYLQVDETPVSVLDPEVVGKAAKGYLWVYHRPGGDVLFDYQPGRSRAGPLEILKEFAGTLQSDGYKVYETLGNLNPGWKRLGCMAHSRRKFHEALKDDPQRAKWFLLQMGALYRVERALRESKASPEQRFVRRQAEAVPVLTEIRAQLDALNPQKPGAKVLPQSPLGKAVRYALSQWEYLNGYVEDGRYEIDQNLVENAIRPSCVGKRNWLFIGHPDAGWRSAVLYTLILNCTRRGIDPWDWMTDVFRRLPTATNFTVSELLPANWKKSAD